MSNPLEDVEDKQAQLDLGVMTARIFMGALHESKSIKIAFLVTAAYWTGLFKTSLLDDEDDVDGT